MDQPSREQGIRRMVGIVAGSGGFEAIAEILAGLPREFAPSVLVIQSMSDRYLEAFVGWLAEKSRLPVTVADDGQEPRPGKVYVAATNRKLTLERGRLQYREHKYGIYDVKDALFRSMASDLGAGATAVILTGMGSDGAEGMRIVREAGGYTIAQDEATSLVYSTPRFAVEMNAACESLPLGAIAPRLQTLVTAGSTRPV